MTRTAGPDSQLGRPARELHHPDRPRDPDHGRPRTFPVVTLLVLWLGAATAGAVVPGLFWLTLVAMAGIMVTGAVGLSLLPPSDEVRHTGREGDVAASSRRVVVPLTTAGPRLPDQRSSRDGDRLGRVA